jgi:hypothetical protein
MAIKVSVHARDTLCETHEVEKYDIFMETGLLKPSILEFVLKSPLFHLILLIPIIALVSLLGPEEKSLGANVRIVYLHGAWVLTAILALAAASLAGLIGLITRRERWHRWSQAFGRTGILFWISYLPVSMWAMQTNWNGLFLSEPRWRIAVIFAVTGLLLQVGLTLIGLPALTSAGNLVFGTALAIGLMNVDTVLHPPPSPIFSSGNGRIEFHFIGLNLLLLLAAWSVTRLWYRGKKA